VKTLYRIQNVSDATLRHECGSWHLSVMMLLASLAIWFTSMAAIASAQEEKPVKYTATALLLVAMQEKPILDDGACQRFDRDRFDIYKNTQQQLLVSRFVLLAALRKPEAAKLLSVQSKQQTGDPVKWLAGRLRVSFPSKAEIMEVSLSSDDPKEAANLVNAVVNAYLQEVVNAERDMKRLRLNELDRAFHDRENTIRAKREDLMKLADQTGTSDTATLTLKQKLALEELAIYGQELAKTRFKLQRSRKTLAVLKASLQDAKEGERGELQREIKRLEISVSVLSEQQKELENALEHKRKEAERFGRSSVAVDIEMMRADIKNLEAVLTLIATEREKLTIESRAAPRVTLLQRAEASED
jgi:capsular polysaccharide biosynthesis protein